VLPFSALFIPDYLPLSLNYSCVIIDQLDLLKVCSSPQTAVNAWIEHFISLIERRHDTQHNDNQHYGTQHNEIQQNVNQLKDIQHNDIQRNDNQQHDKSDNDNQHNDT
jgi:hypothetical protein